VVEERLFLKGSSRRTVRGSAKRSGPAHARANQRLIGAPGDAGEAVEVVGGTSGSARIRMRPSQG